jgi:hypothetical protein
MVLKVMPPVPFDEIANETVGETKAKLRTLILNELLKIRNVD